MDTHSDGALFLVTVSMADVRRGDQVRISAKDLDDPWIAGQIRKRNLVQLEPFPELPAEDETPGEDAATEPQELTGDAESPEADEPVDEAEEPVAALP